MAGFLVEADWWLYLVLLVSILILLAINIYIIVIWQHPDDRNESYFPKAIVVSHNVCTLCYSSVITNIEDIF